jgi:hypothetical protein
MRCSITCTDDHAGVSDSGVHLEITAQLRAVEKSVRACRRHYEKSSNELKVIVIANLGKPD